MPKTTYLARVSVESVVDDEEERMAFITGIGLFNGMELNNNVIY